MGLGKKSKQVISFVGWRLLAVFVTLLFILVITNLVFYVVPGDPARIMLGTNASEAEVMALRQTLGLEQPWPQQIATYVGGLFRGDLGTSMRFSLPVTDLLGSRFTLSLMLAMEALVLVLLVGIPLAVLSAKKPGGALDTLINVVTQTGLAIPSFFVAILLTLLLGLVFHNFGGVLYIEPERGLWLSIRSLFLPAVAVAIPRIAWVVQFLRQALIEQRSMDYVRTAKGKGVSAFRLYSVHLLRNALVPLVTTMGIVLAELFAGAIVIEQVYNLPGLGRLLITAIEARDFPLTQGIILLVASLVVLVGFVVDLLNQAIDPRLRRSNEKGGR